MQRVVRSAFLLVAGFVLAACSDSESTTYPTQKPKAASADRAGAMVGFGFHTTNVTGFGPGIVSLTGGGSYDPSTSASEDAAFGHGNGGFSCLNTVDRLNLNGCQTGQGVRWDTEELLASVPFKCNAAEAARTAVTDEHTAVFQADFYRAGDGNDESFKAKMIVADHDLDDQQPGVQNVWIQGVGCGTGTVNFSQAGRPFLN